MKKWIAASAFLTVTAIIIGFSVSTTAAGGKADVIFIHGFQGQQYFTAAFDDEPSLLSTAQNTFQHWGNFFYPKVRVGMVPWDVKNTLIRATSNPADPRPGWMKVADRYLKLIDEQGFGQNGIIAITHSTGGLVTDILMSQCYLAQYNSDPNIKKYYKVWQKTIGVIHVASAAGGVELANIANDLVYGTCSWPVIGDVLKMVFPFLKCSDPSSLGAGYDLQPSVARSQNGSSLIRVPAFMIAGNGNMALNVIKPVLKGTSDGLVAMHSACGGNKHDSYESCAGGLAADGQLKSQKSPVNYAYHYPYLMTTEGHLSEMNPGSMNHSLNKWEERETLISNYGSWSNAEVDYYSTGWWLWKKNYKNIKNDKSRTLGEIVASHFRLTY
jgi:hypothetical protein